MKNFTMPLITLSTLILLSLSPIMAMESLQTDFFYQETDFSSQYLFWDDLFPELSSYHSYSDDSDSTSKEQLTKEVDPRPYKCSICGYKKTFTAPRYLNRHMNIYHPVKDIYEDEDSESIIDVLGFDADDDTSDRPPVAYIDVIGFDTNDTL